MWGAAQVAGQQRDMHFRIQAQAPSWWDFIVSGRTHIAGHVQLDGVAEQAVLEGELRIRPRHIRYEFGFQDSSGRPLRFVGQKDLRYLNLLKTLRDLPGAIQDERGQGVGEARLRFRLRDLPAFLASFRRL